MFFAQILHVRARPDVQMEAAEAHFFELVYLPDGFILTKGGVPRPEKYGSVFA